MKKINPNLIKSFLFTPAIKANFYQKVLHLQGKDKPDAIIFDLEDSVAEPKKDEARQILLEQLYYDADTRDRFFNQYLILIRINKYGTKWFNDDLAALKKIKPHFVRLAKVETGKEIELIRRATNHSQMAICVESLEGYFNLDRIFQSMLPGDIFNLGYEDLSGELMMERPSRLDQPNPLTTIILDSLIRARRSKITMIDSVSRKFKTVKNLKDLAQECAYTRSLGLSGKTAIHPSQVAVINKAFNRDKEIKNAQKSLAQFDQLSDGTFVTVNQSFEMKDTPSFKMYRRLLGSIS